MKPQNTSPRYLWVEQLPEGLEYTEGEQAPMPKNDDRTIWSSKNGDMRKDLRYRKLPPVKSLPPQQQTAYLHRESKGRGGKTVTLVKNLVLSEKDLKALAKKLKRACGSGGTIKDGVIEIQGDHRQKIADTLRKQGYQVKIAGG